MRDPHTRSLRSYRSQLGLGQEKEALTATLQTSRQVFVSLSARVSIAPVKLSSCVRFPVRNRPHFIHEKLVCCSHPTGESFASSSLLNRTGRKAGKRAQGERSQCRSDREDDRAEPSFPEVSRTQAFRRKSQAKRSQRVSPTCLIHTMGRSRNRLAFTTHNRRNHDDVSRSRRVHLTLKLR